MRVPMFRLEETSDEELQRVIDDVTRVVRSGQLILGKEVEAFEEEFAGYIGVNHCVGVANGTDALELALLASGVGVGSTVGVTGNAGFYSATAALSLGAGLHFIDVEIANGLMSFSDLSRVLDERRLDVLVVTHLFGQIHPKISEIQDLCRKKGASLIEDCAQAHGSRSKNRLAGSYGDFSTFSFYPTKNLGGLGDAGAVMTNNSEHAAVLRSLRQYGWGERYVSSRIGMNSRLDELQAAVLRRRLSNLDQDNSRRVQIARSYSALLSERKGVLSLLDFGAEGGFVGHLYPVLVNPSLRDELRVQLSELGVSTSVHYPTPDHKQDPLAKEPQSGNYSITELFCSSVLSLPIFPSMTEPEIQHVIHSTNQVTTRL